jgi:hypothetical protein
MSNTNNKNAFANLNIKRPSGETNVTPEMLDKLKDKPKLVRMVIDITDDQHAKLKLYAVKNKKTMINVLRKFIDDLPTD